MPFESIETYKYRRANGKVVFKNVKKVFNSIQHRLNWVLYMENKGKKIIS